MALRQANMVKFLTASGGGTLEAKAGKSLLVKGIHSLPSTNETYLTLLVDRVTSLFVRTKGKSGNHAPFPANTIGAAAALRAYTLLDILRDMGKPIYIPIAEGEVLTLQRYAEAGAVALIYDEYDAGDVKKTDMNGSMADAYRFIQYLTFAAAITTDVEHLLDTQLSPNYYPGIGVNGNPCPDGIKASVLGIAACPSTRGSGAANLGYTTKLHIKKNTLDVFDSDLAGFPFVGDVSHTGASASYDPVYSIIGPATNEEQSPPLLFANPIELIAGDELFVYVTTAGGAGAGLSAADLDVALILEINKSR